VIGRARSLLDRLLARHRAIATDAPTDADLLARFARDRDPAAFELLVWRHGGTVLGVCRRALRDEHAAEDAFQAVFLVLARKAGAVRGNLGGWLFKVARRVSARAAARRHAVCEVRDTPAPSEPDAAERAELRALLDAEIARLPERLRAAVVLCYLGDHTTEAAARELGCPRGTVLSRLSAARAKLAARLARRGVALPAALAVPALGAPLVSSASAAARDLALAVPLASELATEVLRAMNRSTVLAALGASGFAAVLVLGAGFGAAQPAAQPVANAPLAPPPVAAAQPPAAPDRNELDRRAKVLEAAAEALKFEIEAAEKALAVLGKDARDTQKVARERKRLEETEEEYRRTLREATKLGVEVGVLKRTVEQKSEFTPADELIQQEFARDNKLTQLTSAVTNIESRLNFEFRAGDSKETPAIKARREELKRAEATIADYKAKARDEMIDRIRKRATVALRERLDQVNTDYQIKTEYAKRLKDELDALRTVLDALEKSAVDRTGELRAALEPQRAALARLQTELLATRLQKQGVTLPPAAPAVGDDKLDRILRELAELRKDVQELKRK